jgi:hypothetical protein
MTRPDRPVPVRRLLLRAACALPLLAAAHRSPAAEPERSVKAAFLLKFIGYVEFGAGGPAPGEPLVIGVIGADDVAAELGRLAPRAPRPVAVRALRSGESLAGVHVLFIGGGESDRAERLLRAATRQGALGVTEFDGGLREGSVINFRVVDQRVRFEVSLAAADQANLRLSSRLLSVAYLVQKD